MVPLVAKVNALVSQATFAQEDCPPLTLATAASCHRLRVALLGARVLGAVDRARRRLLARRACRGKRGVEPRAAIGGTLTITLAIHRSTYGNHVDEILAYCDTV